MEEDVTRRSGTELEMKPAMVKWAQLENLPGQNTIIASSSAERLDPHGNLGLKD